MTVFALSIVSCTKTLYTPLPNPMDTSVRNTVVYNYSSLADSLQSTLYLTFISADRNYYIQNDAGNISFNYWPNANTLDLLSDAYLRTKNILYTQRMLMLLNGIKVANGGSYSNEFYDDMGWLANSSLRAFNITNNPSYLTTSQLLYQEIKGGSNSIMGGGIAWQHLQLYYKNMPSTGNATILACKFYELQGNAEDLLFAKTLYAWMRANLFNSTSGVVYDGINRNQDGKIDNREFTYNQGLFIGSAVELYTITKDPMYLNDAILTANNEMVDPNLTQNGILKNEGQGDGGLFKGISVRYFSLLIELPDLNSNIRLVYENFLQKNAQSLYLNGINRPVLMISPDWTKVLPGNTDLTTQLCGMIMIEVAASLKSEGKIQ